MVLRGAFLFVLLAVLAAAQCPNSGIVQLASVNSGKVLDVAGGSGPAAKLDAAGVQQWSNAHTPNQQWTVLPVSGLYLGISSTGAIQAWQCAAGKATILWSAPRFADGETPAGASNGKNRVFTLAHQPAGSSLLLVLNGMVLKLGATHDYTLAGRQITFTSAAAIPSSSADLLQAWYRW